jgi:hypothetical protein
MCSCVESKFNLGGGGGAWGGSGDGVGDGGSKEGMGWDCRLGGELARL